jgi:hypothetical protein
VCVCVGGGGVDGGRNLFFFEFFGVQIVTKWGEGVFIGRWGTKFAFSDFLEFRQLKNG